MSAFSPKRPLRVAVLGATGSVGQRFVSLLDGHPWFELVRLCASPRRVGEAYGASVAWAGATPCPAAAAAIKLSGTEPEGHIDLVFCALGADIAGPIEEAWAAAGALVVSNAASHRMHPEVPLLIPEVNAEHLELARKQSFGPGAILTGPNCSSAGLVLALAPLQQAFGLRRVSVVTLQALSGAGLPGVPSMQAVDNIVPYIAGEEAKLESEPLKLLGTLAAGVITPADFVISATATRVPVIDGHTEVVSLELDGDPSPAAVAEVLRAFRGAPDIAALPSAPAEPIVVLEEPDAPQPLRHRDLQAGMATVIGRIRPCPVQGIKFVLLTHNTLRGAAGGALLIAEAALARGIRN